MWLRVFGIGILIEMIQLGLKQPKKFRKFKEGLDI
jgi:hypothetical protein